MAAPNQRERLLAADVRATSLTLIMKYLKDDSAENDKYRKDLLLKLSTNILPRKTELTGEDGDPIKIEGVEIAVRKNESTV